MINIKQNVLERLERDHYAALCAGRDAINRYDKHLDDGGEPNAVMDAEVEAASAKVKETAEALRVASSN